MGWVGFASSASLMCLCLVLVFGALAWWRLRSAKSKVLTSTDVLGAMKAAENVELTPEEEQAIEDGVAQATATIDASKEKPPQHQQQQQQAPQQAPEADAAQEEEPKTAAEKAKEFVDEYKGTMIAVGIQVTIPMVMAAANRVGPKVVQKALGRMRTKIAARVSSTVAKVAVKVLKAIGQRLGITALQKFGMMAVTKLAAGTAAAGPVGTAVVAAQLAIEATLMALDFADAGGYLKMGTKRQYIKMRDDIVKELKQAYKESGAEYPGIVGPTSSLDEQTLAKQVEELAVQIASDPEGELLKPILEAAYAKMLGRTDLTDDAAIDAFIEAEMEANLTDDDKAYDLAFARICASLGGKLVGKEQCSWSTKEQCQQSYTWPPDENSVYAEWKNDRCEAAAGTMRLICEGNSLDYDEATGVCKIDENYCKSKGAEWRWNDEIKDHDCTIPLGQDILENLFGTTIVRGLKQIFDPKQYESCAEGEFDDVYTCRKVTCPASHPDADKVTGLCYKPCPEGWHKAGCCLCEQDCPAGWTDTGATCTKRECPADKPDKQADLCYAACPAGYAGNGPVCWEQCRPGEVNDGAFCRVPNETYGNGVGAAKSRRPCPAGMRDDGTSCYADPITSSSRLPSKAPCDPGERDDGTSCYKDSYGRGAGYVRTKGGWERCLRENPQGCEVYGALNYPKCRPGYHNRGCCVCEPDGGPGIKKTVVQRYRCNADEDLIASVCYKKCGPGYHRQGVLCVPDGGAGIKVNLAERLYCPSGTTEIGGLCYKNCRAGYQFQGGNICHKIGTGVSRAKKSQGRGGGVTDIKSMGKEVPKAAGVGRIPEGTQVRGKKRIVAFSTKNN